jgi:coiled-coil domain-containing protein 55
VANVERGSSNPSQTQNAFRARHSTSFDHPPSLPFPIENSWINVLVACINIYIFFFLLFIAKNDVTKRSDLSMFYGNLLQKNVSMGGAFSADVKGESRESHKDEKEAIVDGSSRSSPEKTDKSKDKQTHDTKIREENSRRSSKDTKHSRQTRNDRKDRREDDDRPRHREDSDKRPRSHERRRRDSSDDGHYQKQKDYDKEKDRKESRRETDRHSESPRKLDSHRKHDRPDAEERLSQEKKESEKRPEDTKKETTSEQNTEKDVAPSKFVKRSNNETISSAKQRYLERKRARENALQHQTRDDSDED